MFNFSNFAVLTRAAEQEGLCDYERSTYGSGKAEALVEPKVTHRVSREPREHCLT